AGLRYLGNPGTFTNNVLVTGRANALHILERVCNVLRARLSINTKLVTGREIVMLSHLKADIQSADTTEANQPLGLYTLFNVSGTIKSRTLSEFDLSPLADAIFAAAQSGTGHAG
ncbi:MAG: hypothetical protein KGL97_03830, partial [Alphaproteobacteria bacterium]|nr:hypothetical protein [Alphaproteobacteria bacterium]